MSAQALKGQYDTITRLYELAEELVGTAEDKAVQNPDEHLNVVVPLVEQIAESTNTLSEEFIVIAENGKRPARNSKSRIEGALRKIYSSIDSYKKQTQQISKQAAEQLKRVTEPVIEKIRDTVEKVVVVFLDFVDLSLTLIMHQADLDRLKLKEARVAAMLHTSTLKHQH